MKYVYILESEVDSYRHYIGVTDDLKRRLAEHNAGKSPRTSDLFMLKSMIGHQNKVKPKLITLKKS